MANNVFLFKLYFTVDVFCFEHNQIDFINIHANIFHPQKQLSTDEKSAANDDTAVEKIDNNFGTGKEAKSHRLWPQVDKVCTEQLHYARQGVGEGGNGWQLFANEGDMKMYRREQEVDGMVVDPLKACHMVKGVTAREMCHYFFMPEYRNDWESKYESNEKPFSLC